MIKLELNPSPRMLRQFGWASLVAFPLLAYAFAHKFGLPTGGAYGLAALGPIVLLAELAGIHALPRLVFRLLVLITFPIGLVLFPVLIGLIYYGLFTPVAVVMRIAGRDAMHRKPDPKAVSYWNERGPQRPAASYFKLY